MKRAKKRSRKKSQAKHDTGKNNKHPGKDKNSQLWVLLLTAAAVLIIVALIYPINKSNHVQPGKKIFIENISTRNITDKGGDIVSFYIRSEYDVPADCVVNFSVKSTHNSWDIGTIGPHSGKMVEQKVMMPPGKSKFVLSAHCQPIYKDMAGLLEQDKDICDIENPGRNIKQCMNRENADKFFCISLIEQNISYCSCIKELPRKTLCMVYLENDPGLCEQLTEQRDWCYLDYAMNKKNRAACDKIQAEDSRNSCLAVVTNDLELCLGLKEDNKYDCIVHLAQDMHNKSLCEVLDNKADCYDELAWIK